jgi:hypothetical protein
VGPYYQIDTEREDVVARDLGGPEIDDATIDYFAGQILEPIAVRAVLGVAQWVGDTWPEGPDGQLVPAQGRRLYVRARRAYRGDYWARETFLMAIGVSPTPDEILFVDKALKSTFNPDNRHKRKRWETYPPVEARAFLRRRQRDAKDDARRAAAKERPVEPAEILTPERSGDPKAWELDIRLWCIEQAIFSKLPPRRAEVVFLFWQCFDADRPSSTTRVVAEMLGISPRAVRQHCRHAANNREFRDALGF